MSKQLVLLNRSSHRPWDVPKTSHLVWETCIRKVLITKPEVASQIETLSDDQIFIGEHAYKFFLEVICGLHSPVVGETEVFGQFKSFFDEVWSGPGHDQLFKQFVYELNRDAKEVRRTHIRDIGGTSYGSLVRKQIKEFNEVHILGSGKLAKDILPWLVKAKSKVVVHSRNQLRLEELKNENPKIEIAGIHDSTPIRGALVIAAPVRASELTSWLTNRHPEVILDLRGESAMDPFLHGVPVRNLNEFFSQIENNRKKTEAVVEASKAMIEEMSRKFAQKFLL